MYMLALLAVMLVWGFYFSWHDRALWPVDIAVLTVALCALLAYGLRTRCYAAACWLFLGSLTVGEALLVAAFPDRFTMAFGGLLVIISYALLGTWQALVLAALAWGAGVMAWQLARGGATPANDALAVAILYLLTWGATVIAGRTLRRSVEIALRGWSQLRISLLQTRERRAELFRVVRAFEEARPPPTGSGAQSGAGQRYLVDRRKRRDLSVFRIGLYIIDKLLACNASFTVRLTPYFETVG
jgi:hypothetical protein